VFFGAEGVVSTLGGVGASIEPSGCSTVPAMTAKAGFETLGSARAGRLGVVADAATRSGAAGRDGLPAALAGAFQHRLGRR
jgi:hypothetical protein